ncbi:hypothetical protein HPB50_015124 [Hyalomma asiaticum]|uniref:Uncharacterized protein n=1 Tax=Hyalomma asiaticum TaxID=266040 RepID=A0ACB7RKY4_HYAAI|nr:hypothetical protein HPB50_015124 [Hyalomma asiaticum]
MAQNDSACGAATQQLLPAEPVEMSQCCSMDTSTATNSRDRGVQVNSTSTSRVLVTEKAKWTRKGLEERAASAETDRRQVQNGTEKATR